MGEAEHQRVYDQVSYDTHCWYNVRFLDLVFEDDCVLEQLLWSHLRPTKYSPCCRVRLFVTVVHRQCDRILFILTVLCRILTCLNVLHCFNLSEILDIQ